MRHTWRASLWLGWRNATSQGWGLARSLAGIGFAVVLMLVQMGFRDGLVDSSAALSDKLDGDLVLASPDTYRLYSLHSFPRRRLWQARSDSEVAAARPLWVATFQPWKNPRSREVHPIRVVGFDLEDSPFRDAEITAQLGELRHPDTLLIDSRNKSFVGCPPVGTESELCHRRVRVAGHFWLGTDFANNGTVLMSDHNFFNFVGGSLRPQERVSRVQVGLLLLRPGADPARVAGRLRLVLPTDVAVFTKSEFIALDRSYWLTHAPIGAAFNASVVVGFFIGMVICYQILFTDIARNLPQYATLRAIGHRDRFLRTAVLAQAVILALLGFVPALGVTWLSFQAITNFVGLSLRLTAMLIMSQGVLTVTMCALAGLLASRRALVLDPADLF